MKHRGTVDLKREAEGQFRLQCSFKLLTFTFWVVISSCNCHN